MRQTLLLLLFTLPTISFANESLKDQKLAELEERVEILEKKMDLTHNETGQLLEIIQESRAAENRIMRLFKVLHPEDFEGIEIK